MPMIDDRKNDAQLAILPILPLFLHLLHKVPFSTIIVDIIRSYVLNAVINDEK